MRKYSMAGDVYGLVPGNAIIETLDYLQNHAPYKNKCMEVIGVGCCVGAGLFVEGVKTAYYSAALTLLTAELLK